MCACIVLFTYPAVMQQAMGFKGHTYTKLREFNRREVAKLNMQDVCYEFWSKELQTSTTGKGQLSFGSRW